MILARAYSVIAYVAFLASTIWAILFLGNWLISPTVDAMPRSAPLVAILIDAALLGLFALQHTIMARASFKRWWASFAPPVLDRSNFVLLASLLLFATFAFWQPIAGTLWSVSGLARLVIDFVYFYGWIITFGSTFLIDHAGLFGLRASSTEVTQEPDAFKIPGLYRAVRHPMMLGLVIVFWATPLMTLGHLLFAALATGYILVGIWFEERDLISTFGDRYNEYKKSVPMLLPRPFKK